MEKFKIIVCKIKDFFIKNWKIIVYIICSLLILLFLIFAIKTFTNPMNTKITRKNYDNVIEKIRKHSSKENYEKVQAVIAMAEMASWGEDKDKIRDEYLKFDNYTWEVKTVNYQNRLIITVEIENLKNVDIEAFEGVINISDKLDNNLGDFKIKNTKVIPKKAKADVDITFYDDEYYTEIKTISRQNGDLYFSFTPTKLIVNGQEI